jgi:hypothetical protein
MCFHLPKASFEDIVGSVLPNAGDLSPEDDSKFTQL